MNIIQLSLLLLLSLGSIALLGQEVVEMAGNNEASPMGETELVEHDINDTHGYRWQDVKRSVCAIVSPNNLPGTGFLVNTVHNSQQGGQKKLFLVTNEHVVNPKNIAEIDLFISFDYESSKPKLSGQEDENYLANGTFTASVSKLYKVPFIKRMVDEASDIALLEVDIDKIKTERRKEWYTCLDSNGEVDIFHPNSPFYNAYAIGWNINAEIERDNYAQIHHPGGDWKKLIDNPNDILQSSETLEGGIDGYQILELVRFLQVVWNANEELARPGSSGSPIINSLDSRVAAVFFQGSAEENIGRSSLLENSWYLDVNENHVYHRAEGVRGLIDYLDADRTWVSTVPGGYVRDLIQPTTNNFNLPLASTGVFTQRLKQKSFGLLYEELLNFPIIRRESRLGAGLNISTSSNDVYLTVSSVDDNNPFEDSKPYLLYAVKYVPGQGDAEPFGGVALNAGNASDLQVLSDYNTDPFLPLGALQVPTSDFKANYINYTSVKASLAGNAGFVSSIRSEHHFDSLEVKVFRLSDSGTPSQIRAIRIPYLMPYNAVELFQPGQLTNHWQSRKYKPSSGQNSQSLFIDEIEVQQHDEELLLVESNTNGGYLNLVNRQYRIEPVQTSYRDIQGNFIENSITMIINSGVPGQPFFYKVWMDFSEGVDGENYYNFVEGGVLSDLIGAGSETGFVEFEYTMPDNIALGMAPGDTKHVRMRVAISSTNNITQDGIYAQGEVEDYLVKLVAPTMPVLHAQDAEPSGAQEVVIDQSGLLGTSTIGMTGGVASDPWHRRLGENAFHLPNTNDYLSLDDNNQFIHDAFTQRTVAFWLYNENSAGLQDLYDEGGSTHGFGIRLNAGKPELAVRNSGNQVTLSGEQSLPLDEWVHLMGVFTGGNLLLYVNGELVAEDSNIGYNQVPYHGDAAAWGATQGANAFNAVNNNFNGWLDDLRVYDVALQQEGLAMLLRQATDITSGLELRHQLDNDYTDASGNNITSSAQSGLQFTDVAAQGSHAMFADAQGKYVDLDTGNAFIHDAFTERTIGFWMKSGATSGKQDIFDEGGSTNGIALRINNGQIELAVQNSHQIAMTSSCVEGFEWIHVAGVFDNGRLQLYVNGELVAENSNVGFTTVGAHGDGAGFGATRGSNAFDQVNNNYWGTLDDLSIYSRALSNSDISLLMAQADVTPNPDLCGSQAMMGASDGSSEKAGSNRFMESTPTPSSSYGYSNVPLRVYPNPSADGRFVVDFELETPAPVHLAVIALDGRQVMTRTLNPSSAGQQRIQLEQTQGLPAGIYLLQVNFGDRQESKKLVIGR